MKSMAGIVVMALVVLTSCGPLPSEEQAQVGAEEHFTSQEAALAGDCSVQIECANGTTRSCSGSGFSCTASAANNGTVTCNGVSSSCGLIIQPVCSCRSDGCCNFRCTTPDPDCFVIPHDPAQNQP
uniref:Putative lipoprotein n=1 Tax=Myxococcus virescens TaxID=83456 RepID=A0A7D5T1G7_9BACT|nr:putative lipoprotein [Myxococcus virescens]